MPEFIKSPDADDLIHDILGLANKHLVPDRYQFFAAILSDLAEKGLRDLLKKRISSIDGFDVAELGDGPQE